MELKVSNSYHIRINKDAPSDFTIQELERLLKAESNLYPSFARIPRPFRAGMNCAGLT